MRSAPIAQQHESETRIGGFLDWYARLLAGAAALDRDGIRAGQFLPAWNLRHVRSRKTVGGVGYEEPAGVEAAAEEEQRSKADGETKHQLPAVRWGVPIVLVEAHRWRLILVGKPRFARYSEDLRILARARDSVSIPEGHNGAAANGEAHVTR